MKKKYKNMSAKELYFASIGCGCCTYGDEPTWEDIKTQLIKELTIEKEPQ